MKVSTEDAETDAATMFSIFRKRSLPRQRIFDLACDCLAPFLVTQGQAEFLAMARVGYIGFRAKSAFCCANFATIPDDTICYAKLADIPTFSAGLANPHWKLADPNLIPEELLVICAEISRATKPWKPKAQKRPRKTK